ncbi:MAG: alanine dehydrogenase [Bacillota bacterium]|nr:alanine dehydrogenase [Bacillota bacterium]
MIIGVPREIKSDENRVAITPGGVEVFVNSGHKVLIEKLAGEGSGFSDVQYKDAGAEIIAEPDDLFSRSEMILKVKEPQTSEYAYFREGLVLFTFLHLGAAPKLAKALMESKVTGISYDTVQKADRSLPLLAPMSEVAGKMAVQVGAHYLEKRAGGAGVLLGGVPGVPPAHVVVIGGGMVGVNAAKVALGMGARVSLLDIDANKLRYLDDIFGGRIDTVISNHYWVSKLVAEADLLVGAVLIPGAKAPHIVTEEMIMQMKPGSVVVDVAIDQGGCIETCDMPTTHSDPIIEKHGVIHYSVANIPGAVPRTSTLALTNATLPYALKIADKGLENAIKEDSALAKGMNTYAGKIVHEIVASSLELPYTPIEELL